MLATYLLNCSETFFGLTYVQTQKLAYEFAKAKDLKMPESWKINGQAGRDWMFGFMERHNSLSLRKAENVSISRALSFSPYNIQIFYDNLEKLNSEYKFPPARILNLDETGIPTVVNSPPVIAQRGKKEVGNIVTAAGNSIPLVYVFHRKKIDECWLNGSPNGCVAFPSPTGWMTSDLIPLVLNHLKENMNCTRENPILLLLDNHSSHISYPSIEFCKNNGIVLLSFPPHCTHRIQPLDVSIFSSFKTSMKQVQKNHLDSSKCITAINVQSLPFLSSSPFNGAFCRTNIISGFKNTGIWSLDKNIFKSFDYHALAVSHVKENIEPARNSPVVVPPALDSPAINLPDAHSIFPEDIRPYPQIKTKGQGNRKSRKQKSTIHTASPEAVERKKQYLGKKIEDRQKENNKTNAVKRKLVFKKNPRKKVEGSCASVFKKTKIQKNEDDANCLVCGENFLSSSPGEEWLRCDSCFGWVHLSCADHDISDSSYICDFCE